MKNGFTLIELLAVIVILAIIALIATPIIINIINDAKASSNERSIELYGSAIKNAIAKEQLNGKIVAAGNYSTETLPFEVEYEGEVDCDEVQIKEDGSVYLAGCTVNGTEVDYTYGEKEESEPTTPQVTRYYSWSRGNISNGLPDGAMLDVSDIDTKGHSFYLAFDVELDEENNQKVTAAYVCFTRNDQEYCLKGADGGASYETNKAIMKEAFGESTCSFGGDSSSCSVGGLNAPAHSVGIDYAGDVYANDGIAGCDIDSDGSFMCNES